MKIFHAYSVVWKVVWLSDRHWRHFDPDVGSSKCTFLVKFLSISDFRLTNSFKVCWCWKMLKGPGSSSFPSSNHFFLLCTKKVKLDNLCLFLAQCDSLFFLSFFSGHDLGYCFCRNCPLKLWKMLFFLHNGLNFLHTCMVIRTNKKSVTDTADHTLKHLLFLPCWDRLWKSVKTPVRVRLKYIYDSKCFALCWSPYVEKANCDSFFSRGGFQESLAESI